MGNPFTMMDEYHQKYWQNYHKIVSSPGARSMSDHDIHKATHYITREKTMEQADPHSEKPGNEQA